MHRPRVERADSRNAAGLSRAELGARTRKDELCRKSGERFGIAALYDMYAQRIETFRHDPPPPDWDGVYEGKVNEAGRTGHYLGKLLDVRER